MAGSLSVSGSLTLMRVSQEGSRRVVAAGLPMGGEASSSPSLRLATEFADTRRSLQTPIYLRADKHGAIPDDLACIVERRGSIDRAGWYGAWVRSTVHAGGGAIEFARRCRGAGSLVKDWAVVGSAPNKTRIARLRRR